MRLVISSLFFFFFSFSAFGQSPLAEMTKGMQAYDGYFNFFWDEDKGKIWLEVDKLDQEFLYVNSLPAGLGSNDIGLDRNQLGNTRVVKFIKSGPKVLLIQPNYDYRAVSDNEDERKSVQEAFAQSVLWGFSSKETSDGKLLIDITKFLLRDAHGVAARLKQRKQGNYKVDASRSVIYLGRTKNFPQNSEFEAMITFTGDGSGKWVRSIAPSSDALTVRMHHSFVALPDDNYTPRVFDPRSGYNARSYQDYATPIDQSLTKRFIPRHRLKKKNPKAKLSEPVEPIIYYLDRGAPEPIKSALIEGASWWNQAYEAAGFKNAFQVKVLPEGADPMDVRYNVINWVHRSTRGWSYGSSVTDPRTGEIIKGHVLLGSLRVRQDFMIAQGLVDAYESGKDVDPRMLAMALARLRQLSAHEVGHTLGLSHNFASSINNRSSVMDYPYPFIQLKSDGTLDFSEAYDVGIGDWDKRTIIYGYSDFPKGTDEAAALDAILKENIRLGLQYISDQDARPAHGAHPNAHLWDNGDAVGEFWRLSEVRAAALASFDETNIPEGTPMAMLENVLVPLYLAHRYQVEALSKMIGGVEYTYAVRGDGQVTNKMVDAEKQQEALDAMLASLDPDFLKISEDIIQLIPPQPIGYGRGRELFKVRTGLTFDPIGAAESSAQHTVQFMLNPERLARIIEQHARNNKHLSLNSYFDKIMVAVKVDPNADTYSQELQRMVEKLVVMHILQLAADKEVMPQVAAVAMLKVSDLQALLRAGMASTGDVAQKAHYTYLMGLLGQFSRNPSEFKVPPSKPMPDGSPIGCTHMH